MAKFPGQIPWRAIPVMAADTRIPGHSSEPQHEKFRGDAEARESVGYKVPCVTFGSAKVQPPYCLPNLS